MRALVRRRSRPGEPCEPSFAGGPVEHQGGYYDTPPRVTCDVRLSVEGEEMLLIVADIGRKIRFRVGKVPFYTSRMVPTPPPLMLQECFT